VQNLAAGSRTASGLRLLSGVTNRQPGGAATTTTTSRTPASTGPTTAWASAHRLRLASQLGSDELGRGAAQLALGSLANNTVKTYNTRWAAFTAFCSSIGERSLPASTATCAKYLTHLYQSGRVQPETAQKYLSAINTVHRDVFGYAEGSPAGGAVISSVIKGWQQRRSHQPQARQAKRMPLPARVAGSALRRVLLDGDASQPHLPLGSLRALMYTALGFQLMARAGSATGLVFGDVETVAGALRVTLRVMKGKQRQPTLHSVTLPAGRAPELRAALRHWQRRRDAAWAAAGGGAPSAARRYFELPGERGFSEGGESACASSWLRSACALLGAAPPAGHLWSSHSLRSGGASAAHAAGAFLATVRHVGGWARDSSVVHDYIDATVMWCPDAELFFGWMRPGPPSAAPLPPPPPPPPPL
jgi:hypothetical protein